MTIKEELINVIKVRMEVLNNSLFNDEVLIPLLYLIMNNATVEMWIQSKLRSYIVVYCREIDRISCLIHLLGFDSTSPYKEESYISLFKLIIEEK